MKTEIEIIRTDEENQKGFIIGLDNNLVIIQNDTVGEIQEWNLEDLKQCLKFI